MPTEPPYERNARKPHRRQWSWRKRVLTALTGGVALTCFVAAGAALWLWFTPARFAETPPLRLFGLLGLFVLPAATIAFQALDRRDARATSTEVVASPERTIHPAPRVRRHDQPGRRRPASASPRTRSVR